MTVSYLFLEEMLTVPFLQKCYQFQPLLQFCDTVLESCHSRSAPNAWCLRAHSQEAAPLPFSVGFPTPTLVRIEHSGKSSQGFLSGFSKFLEECLALQEGPQQQFIRRMWTGQQEHSQSGTGKSIHDARLHPPLCAHQSRSPQVLVVLSLGRGLRTSGRFTTSSVTGDSVFSSTSSYLKI